jgi:ABC-type dipeptide/oligopeptide/nickel transport system permease component
MKVMSIIGIVWFSICLMGTLEIGVDLEASAVAGIIGLLFALPFAIIALVKSNKQEKENTIKVMSIIGIVWFSIWLMGAFAWIVDDLEASSGSGILGLLYAIPLAIVALVKSNKQEKNIV